MAFPPAHVLVGIGMAEVVRGAAPLPRARAWALAAALAVLPDADFVLEIALGRAGAYHGTFTHSVVATVGVALLFCLLLDRRWGVLAGAAWGSHLLVDLLDDRGRTNVLLGWPFTQERPFAIARVFPQVPFNPGYGLCDAVASLFSAEVVGALVVQTAIGAGFFAALFLLGRGVRALRTKRRA